MRSIEERLNAIDEQIARLETKRVELLVKLTNSRKRGRPTAKMIPFPAPKVDMVFHDAPIFQQRDAIW